MPAICKAAGWIKLIPSSAQYNDPTQYVMVEGKLSKSLNTTTSTLMEASD